MKIKNNIFEKEERTELIKNCRSLIFNNCFESHLYGLSLDKNLKLNIICKKWETILLETGKTVFDIIKLSLDLRNSQIKEFPDNLSVGGGLDLSGSQIKELPDNLSVGGSLDLSYSQIKELPDNLSVGGSLYLNYSQIKELPDNLSVGGKIYKDF
jgi:hypothetical protein